MTKDLLLKTKITLPDGTEQEQDPSEKERPKWPYKPSNFKAGSTNCPFSLIYKKWVVHPSDKSRHPAF